MAIIGTFPYTILNGQPEDAVPVMSDFNFIQSQINLNGAPIASPAFTGIPTCPTAVLGTSSIQIASTAFVMQSFASPGPIGGTTPGSGAFTTITASGAITGNVTGNLTGSVTGNASGTAGSLSGGSAGTLPYQSGANTTAMLSPGTNGQLLSLVAGLPVWSTITSGTLADPGTYTIGDLIIKWGTTVMSGINQAVTFATPFPAACFVVVTNGGQTTGTYYQTHTNTITASGFNIYSNSGAITTHWIAIGH